MGSLADVKHVVIVMQENRSFDHYFGTLPGVRGFRDPAALKQADGSSIFAQKRPGAAALHPFPLDTTRTRAQNMQGNWHEWAAQHQAWNNGKLDLFRVAQPHDTCLGYFTHTDIPYHHALARTFTVCDMYFSSVLGPTAPNRLYLMSGTIDPEGKHGEPATGNPGGKAGETHDPKYGWRSYPEALAAQDVSFAIYDEQSAYEVDPPDPKRAHAAPFDLNVAAYFAGWKQLKHDHHRPGPHRFEHDVEHEQLPRVSWIIPRYDKSEHPSYAPADGAHFLAGKVRALLASERYWKNTVFVIVYDENDGFFDHVPPPTSPPGTPQEWVNSKDAEGCVGPGFRVPCIIVSPWTLGGRVCSLPFDHTSVLRLLEGVTGVEAENISAYRRLTLHSLAEALDFSHQVARSDVPALPSTQPYESAKGELPAPIPPPVWPPSRDRLAAIGWPGKHAYFFKAGRYLRYTTGDTAHTAKPDADYPKAISGRWPGVLQVDAGFVQPNGKAYVFSGRNYLRYHGDDSHPDAVASSYTVDSDYPKLISKAWTGVWSSDIDAAVVWPDGKTYLFKGPEFVRCAQNEHTADGGPRAIADHFPRLSQAFPFGIDAVVVWSSETAYFFKDDRYARYTIAGSGRGVDEGYPKSISSFSPELAAFLRES